MSTVGNEEIFNIGRRLREERERLGMSLETFGTRIGTTGRTIHKYERNETSPRASELLTASSLGLDVLYVVTGEKAPLGAVETAPAYAESAQLASYIAGLKLSEQDAELLKTMASRLAK